MKAILIRTGSVPVHSSFLPGSPRVVSLPVHDSFAGAFSCEKSDLASPRISLHLEANRRSSINRALSEPDLIRSGSDLSGCFSRLSGVGSKSLPAKIPEEVCVSESESESESEWVDIFEGIGSLILAEKSFDRRIYAGNRLAVDELGFPGGGIGKGRTSGGGSGKNGYGTGGFAGGNADRSKIGAYYQEMLWSNPTNSLLLRNYAKFLHEVERDMVKAEEYYGRAILASPGDGEVLALYGKLIWETHRDGDRAKSYFDQAVKACPHDCAVMGSYAQFMWEADEEEVEEEEIQRQVELSSSSSSSATMVEVF